MNENRLSRRDVKIMYVFRNEMKERFLQKKKKEKIWDETSVIFYRFPRKREREREERKTFWKLIEYLCICALNYPRLTILGLRCFNHEYFKLLQTAEGEEQHNAGNECIMDKEREERGRIKIFYQHVRQRCGCTENSYFHDGWCERTRQEEFSIVWRMNVGFMKIFNLIADGMWTYASRRFPILWCHGNFLSYDVMEISHLMTSWKFPILWRYGNFLSYGVMEISYLMAS